MTRPHTLTETIAITLRRQEALADLRQRRPFDRAEMAEAAALERRLVHQVWQLHQRDAQIRTKGSCLPAPIRTNILEFA